MHASIKRKFASVTVEGLPVKAINKALGLDLDEAPLTFTAGAQRHAHGGHPDDFEICIKHFEQMVCSPLYAGDDLRNSGKIEIISKIAAVDGGGFMLMAVVIETDEAGHYRVASCYRLNETKIQNRREKNRLSVLIYD